VTEGASQPKRAVVTIGYAHRTFPELCELLRRSGVQIVADVRSSPYSRQWPEFSRPQLAERLPKLGITYHHFKDLGGKGREESERSPNAGLPGAWRAYADHMRTETFARSLRRLTTLAVIGPVAILCTEADPAQCHRRLIADALTVLGLPVWHLDAAGTAVAHTLTPRLEVREGQITYPPVGEQLPLF
jgi:uncharacterized protein (DUF488 family)